MMHTTTPPQKTADVQHRQKIINPRSQRANDDRCAPMRMRNVERAHDLAFLFKPVIDKAARNLTEGGKQNLRTIHQQTNQPTNRTTENVQPAPRPRADDGERELREVQCQPKHGFQLSPRAHGATPTTRDLTEKEGRRKQGVEIPLARG